MMVRTFQELLHGSHRAVKTGHGGPLDFELENILKIIEALQNTEPSKNVLFKKTGHWSTDGGSTDGEFLMKIPFYWSSALENLVNNFSKMVPLLTFNLYKDGPLWQHVGQHHLPVPVQAAGEWNFCKSVCLHSRDPLEGIIFTFVHEHCSLKIRPRIFQAFRYFGWWTLAPLLLLHFLLCCTAFQMGEHFFISWM